MLNVLSINERFGPTIQGEGPDIGKPCFFLRTHGCPVKCPGCDTAYTWDGSEKGEKLNPLEIQSWALSWAVQYPKCGLVVTGGEPLMHYNNEAFHAVLGTLRRHLPWISLETSGYVGTANPLGRFINFLRLFSAVTLSPKITPCLHGTKLSDADLLVNVHSILGAFSARPRDLALKFVAEGEEDLEVVDAFCTEYQIRSRKIPVYIMPFALTGEEVLKVSERLLPLIYDRGYILTPRLHSILWGKKRAV
jgi:7-carboxy-7-deazaguanine synthase